MRLKKYRGIGHLCFKFSAEEFGLFFYKPHIPRFPANCGLGEGVILLRAYVFISKRILDNL